MPPTQAPSEPPLSQPSYNPGAAQHSGGNRARSRTPCHTSAKSRAIRPGNRRPTWAPSSGAGSGGLTPAGRAPYSTGSCASLPKSRAQVPPPAAPLIMAPSVPLPAGLHILGLPSHPTALQLDDVFQCVSAISPSLAALGPRFQLTPVSRRHRRSPAFFLAHLSFANPATVDRILTELREGAKVDDKGRVRLTTSLGVLKVSQAMKVAAAPAIAGGAVSSGRSAAPAKPITVFSSPVHSGSCGGCASKAVATRGMIGRSCVCCRDIISLGEPLVQLPCSHVSHEDCLGRWLDGPLSRGRCPECSMQVRF